VSSASIGVQSFLVGRLGAANVARETDSVDAGAEFVYREAIAVLGRSPRHGNRS
jgi:hypothetical protein